ncbi:hypothetical protein E2C01_049660 [Portunus trituberculatus]|uniref:Uncharacterized protein n=1 Tax=Portunus trituberculatus TaxID=210409 RepID=A0A5B7GDS4_PORTR|nr:hypothetical protein [Portunus trituberculatus]
MLQCFLEYGVVSEQCSESPCFIFPKAASQQSFSKEFTAWVNTMIYCCFPEPNKPLGCGHDHNSDVDRMNG